MPDVCFRRPLFVATMAFFLALAYTAPSAQQQPPSAAVPQRIAAEPPASQRQAVLAKYCVTCHNQRSKTAGLALDTVDPAQVGSHAEIWEAVVRKVRTGAM